jgi:hypothetical protein
MTPVIAQQFNNEPLAVEEMIMEAPFNSGVGVLAQSMAIPTHRGIAFGDYSMGSANMMMNKLFTPAMIVRNQGKLILSNK